MIGGPFRRFFASLLRRPSGARIDWKVEIWPFQWRLGIKGTVAYLNSAILQLIVFYYLREVIAGRFGMTWQVLNAFQMASSSWVRTRAAKFGLLVSQKNYTELDRIFFRLVTIGFAMLCVGSFAFCAFIAAAGYIESKYIGYFTSRILPLLPTVVLSIGACFWLFTDAQWTYIHAHKRSPYLLLTVFGALANGLCVWLLGRAFGVIGVASAYTCMMLFFFLPIWTYVWHRCRREWHEVE
jgi:O-antigen/teichoic acid export membrane protein